MTEVQTGYHPVRGPADGTTPHTASRRRVRGFANGRRRHARGPRAAVTSSSSRISSPAEILHRHRPRRPGSRRRSARAARSSGSRASNLVLVFEKTSTRTRCAFEVAGVRSGRARPPASISSAAQLGHKESVADTARVLRPALPRHRVSRLRPVGGRGARLANCRRAGLERAHRRVPSDADPRRRPHRPRAQRAPARRGGRSATWVTRASTWGTPGSWAPPSSGWSSASPRRATSGRRRRTSRSAAGSRRRPGRACLLTEDMEEGVEPAPTSSTPTSGCRWARTSRSGRSGSSASCRFPGQPARAGGDR